MEDLQKLEQLLQAHDWFYQYADDFSKYSRGSNQRDAIKALMSDLSEQGLGVEAEELFNKYKRS